MACILLLLLGKYAVITMMEKNQSIGRRKKSMLKKIKMQRDEGGFTLIELLIVVAIIAILAAIAIPQFSGYRSRSVRASMIADARNMATALEAYFTDSGTYLPANGDTILGPAAFAAADALVGARASRGNTVLIGSNAGAYTITITNANGVDANFDQDLQLFSSGRCEWAAGQSC
jgi:type IV pilus assembly protein PilA